MINSEILDEILESLLFVSGSGLAVEDIRKQLEVGNKDLDAAICRLQEKYGGKCLHFM